jgi:hypothetical protein
MVETKVDILPNLVVGTDLFTILLQSGNTVIQSINTLAISTGVKQYNINIPPITPIDKITIVANSTNKSIYMDYLKIYIPGTSSIVSSSGITFIRKFDVIATPSNFELYPIGFGNNVYGEQTYAFNFNIDFDVSSYLDNFGFPLTELFLYIRYVPTLTETLKYTNWSTNGIPVKTILPTPVLNIGDKVYGNVIEYSDLQFYQSELYQQTYYISTPYIDDLSQPQRLIWKYNPFIPLTLRYFSDNLYKANISSTSYEQVSSIPYYATKIDNNGNYVWRTILPQGYFDPLTGIGVSYPFVNKKRYLFSNTVFSIIPDLTDANTLNAFSKIVFGTPTKISITPNSDLNNIGKPCL